MITDHAALRAVTTGWNAILAGLPPGTRSVDMSTVSPQTSREVARRVTDRGATMTDVPVSGGVPAAETGSPATMAGGPKDAFWAAVPLLHQVGNTTVNRPGAGPKAG